MYNFRFTVLSNTNNTSNYQSTNETHYTQQNTTITTHKGSQLLILTETRYQLQPSDKELHTEHTAISKGKAVRLQACSGPEGSQEVKVPIFYDNGTGWW